MGRNKMIGFNQKVYQQEMDVWIQDQTTAPFNYKLMREDKTDITLTSPIVKGDTTISVSSGHGFITPLPTPRQYVTIFENNVYTQVQVTAVSGDDITVESPFGVPFTPSATVVRGVVDMNVDGSLSEVEFKCYLRQFTIPIDLQYVVISIWNASAAGDEGTFGDLAALTNGFRMAKENTYNQNYGNYRTNSDFRLFGADVTYNPRSGGGGNYGVDIVFDVKKVYGIVSRLDTSKSELFNTYVRDNLSTLGRFRIAVMGQYTLGE